MSERNHYLFLYSIGPVQSFIASARKAQDLWSGSYLLSHLVQKGMENLEAKLTSLGYERIFPGGINPAATSINMALYPNRFLYHFSGVELDVLFIKELGRDLTESIEKEFARIVKSGVQSFSITDIDDFSDRHIKDFLETYWVAIPYDPYGNYSEQYAAIETALAGRKNIKQFDQPEPEMSLKCSMCGEREALHPSGITKIKDVKVFWNQIAQSDKRFKKNEYLCCICLGKRFTPSYFRSATGPIPFPSTADVASASFKSAILLNAFTEYKTFVDSVSKIPDTPPGCDLPKNQALKAPAIDGQLLYQEYLKDQCQNLSDEHKRLIQNSYHAVRKIIDNKKPSGYFAALVMDGDEMGEKIRSVTAIDEHQKISATLAEFAANEAKDIIEDTYLGKLIYSGGDDVLALISVDDILPAMDALRMAFEKKFKDHGKFSVSCGVCISHYKNPFSVTLQTARDMEKLAKSDKILLNGRNAFAIKVLSHSGNHKLAACNWEVSYASTHGIIYYMIQLKELLQKKIISNNFIYTLKNEFAPVTDNQGRITNGALIKIELHRLMLRAVDSKKLVQFLNRNDLKKSDYINNLAAALYSSFQNMDYNLDNFLSLLEVTNIIGREALL